MQVDRIAAPEAGDTDRERRDALTGEAFAWLRAAELENPGAEIVLRRAAGRAGLAVARGSNGVTGIGLDFGGTWCVEADDEASCHAVAAALDAQRRPRKVATSAHSKGWLRGYLTRDRTIEREHDLLAMRCHDVRGEAEGRWAVAGDVARLEDYDRAYAAERGTTITRDWPDFVARKQTTVLERDGQIVSVLSRSGETASRAAVGGTWTWPAYRRRGLARRLTVFLVRELLREFEAAVLIVDDDNPAAIALYDSVGFVHTGGVWFGYPGEPLTSPAP